MRPPAPLVALALAAGCLYVNPGFDGDGRTTSTSAAADTSTGAPMPGTSTGAGGTGTTAVTDATGTGGDSLGGSTTDDLSGGTGSSSSGGSSGGPGMFTLEATIGTCVLLPTDSQPYVGPDGCEEIARTFNNTQQSGLTVVDTDLNNGGGNGRTALSFFRFDLPPGVVGQPIQTLTLELRVGDGMEAEGDGGHLYSTTPFDLASLDVGAPSQVAELAPALGNVGIDAVVTWPLDPALAVSGDAVLLGLWPSSTATVVYHGHRSPTVKPKLHVMLP